MFAVDGTKVWSSCAVSLHRKGELCYYNLVKVADKVADVDGFVTEYVEEPRVVEGSSVDDIVCGDVAVLANIQDNGLEVFFLVRIQGCIGEKVRVTLNGFFLINADDGADEKAEVLRYGR